LGANERSSTAAEKSGEGMALKIRTKLMTNLIPYSTRIKPN